MVIIFAKSFILDVHTSAGYTSDTAKLSFTMLCYEWFKKANTVKRLHSREQFGRIKTSLKEVFHQIGVHVFKCQSFDAMMRCYMNMVPWVVLAFSGVVKVNDLSKWGTDPNFSDILLHQV